MILTSDYDTQASFYGVKKACEPVHVQLDLSNYNVAVVNTTNAPLNGLSVGARVYSLDDKLLLQREERRDAVAGAVTEGYKLDLAPLLTSNGIGFVKLELRNSSGEAISENFHWLGEESACFRRLNRLPAASLSVTAKSLLAGENIRVRVGLRNTGTVASPADKLTLFSADGSRILPAYFSDNYVSLLPGESRESKIEYPVKSGNGRAQLARGGNLSSQIVQVASSGS